MILPCYRHDEREESTDGIDLSASCSFNLRDRKAWRLALQAGKPERIEEELTFSGLGKLRSQALVR